MNDMRKIKQLTARIQTLARSYNAATALNGLMNLLVDTAMRGMQWSEHDVRLLVANALAKATPFIGREGMGWPKNNEMTRDEYARLETVLNEMVREQSANITLTATLNVVLYMYRRGIKVENVLQILDNAIEIQEFLERGGKKEDLNEMRRALPAWVS